MKTYLLIGLILSLGISAAAQKQKTQPVGDPDRASASSRASGKSSSNGSIDGPILQAGTMLDAELQSAVDVKKSKVGDEVVLKTKKAIKQNGEVIVPKGTQLIGRITEVKQKTKDNATSRIGMVFDRMKGKNLDAPINASIVSVLSGRANAAAGDMLSADVMGTSSGSGSVSRGNSGTSGGGGLLGGVTSTAGGLVGATTSTVGNVAGTATNTVGSTLGNTTSTLGRTVNGLQVSTAASGSATTSSTISAQDKNVRIDKGATFQMRVDGSVN